MCKDWEKKFFEIYFNEDSTTEEIDEVLDTKNDNIPKHLYKYTNLKHIEDLLENNLFYLPEIEKLNDPYEGNILYDLDLQVERFITYLLLKSNKKSEKEDSEKIIDLKKEIGIVKVFLKEDKIPLTSTKTIDKDLILSNMPDAKTIWGILKKMQTKDVKEFFETINELLREDTKVACFTKSKYNNPLWNHYADEHKGICIEYNTTNFSTLLKEHCFPIFYDNAAFSDNMPIKDVEKIKEKYNLKAFLKKSEDWKCENEWRIIISSNIHEKCREYYENDENEYLKLKPKAVYLGKEFYQNNEKDKNKLIEICKKNNIKIYQMKQLKTQYKLKERTYEFDNESFENLKDEKYDKLVETHKINEYSDLLNIIQIDDKTNLRENFIFRGIKKSSYDLKPSSLRKKGDYFKINDYILKSEFNFYLNKTEYLEIDGERGMSFSRKSVDKNKNPVDVTPENDIYSPGELHFKREIYVLLKFLDYTDKIGLKIPANTSVRRWIHNHLAYENKINELWPKPEFYEIISLAQHHGLPTRALDWSYDFKVALYFAVSGILDDNNEDCVLWAFNYKLFENHYHEDEHENEKLVIYRPEYNINSNLKAQKGLFTFLTSDEYEEIDDETSFDQKLIKNLEETKCPNKNFHKVPCYKIDGFEGIEIKDEKIFHKFIISGNLKSKILKDLFLDGYAPENICPNYYGVVNAMKKRARLDNILNDNKS